MVPWRGQGATWLEAAQDCGGSTDMTTPKEPEIPQWKLDLIEECRKLIQAREETLKQRQEWVDTQPPEIKNVSIGK
jgi:hypothetical protein